MSYPGNHYTFGLSTLNPHFQPYLQPSLRINYSNFSVKMDNLPVSDSIMDNSTQSWMIRNSNVPVSAKQKPACSSGNNFVSNYNDSSAAKSLSIMAEIKKETDEVGHNSTCSSYPPNARVTLPSAGINVGNSQHGYQRNSHSSVVSAIVNQGSSFVNAQPLREKPSVTECAPSSYFPGCQHSLLSSGKTPQLNTGADTFGENVNSNTAPCKVQIPYGPLNSMAGILPYNLTPNQIAADFQQKCYSENIKNQCVTTNEKSQPMILNQNTGVTGAGEHGKKNKDNSSAASHTKHIPGQMQVKEKTLFVCDVCNKAFTRKDHMNRHKSKIHSSETKMTEASHINTLNKISDVPNDCLKNNPLPGISPLESVSSINLINGGLSINPDCALLYDSLRESQMKLNVSREKPYECMECQKIFTRKDHVFRHKMGHAKLRPFQCTICMKIFTRKDHLVRHRNIHTKERPYNCTQCDKVFTRKDHLDRHLAKHLKDLQLPKVTC